jgi:hypothetical protein
MICRHIRDLNNQHEIRSGRHPVTLLDCGLDGDTLFKFRQSLRRLLIQRDFDNRS